jgi:hypothetical protein
VVSSLIGLFSATYDKCDLFQVWISKFKLHMHMKFGTKHRAGAKPIAHCTMLRAGGALSDIQISNFERGRAVAAAITSSHIGHDGKISVLTKPRHS